MHKNEKSAVMSLAAIMGFRMLGLFMILPVFSVAADQFHNATPLLVGIALGIYGLTQAMFQMPFGTLSDRIGRKPIITLGLVLFAIGSVICALSHSISGLIIGRAIQGAGAIGSTTLALVADLTRDEFRSKAMAMIGLIIGFAFTLALVIGPAINAVWHLSGIFWLTAVLSLAGIAMLHISVPNPPKLYNDQHTEALSKRIGTILKNTQLLRLNAGIFCLHATLTALFLAVPILLTRYLQLSEGKQILLYLVVLCVSFFSAVPLIIIAEKRRQMKSMFVAAITTLTIVSLALSILHHSAISIAVLLLIFFTAFTLLEASLPSLVSKITPIRNKGTAMGIYSTAQFFGIFCGGLFGGLVFSHFHILGIFILCAVFTFIWLFIAISMQQPPYLSTLIFASDIDDQQFPSLSQQLKAIPGVAEVALMAEESLLYLKVDKKLISKDELRKRIEGVTLS